MLCSVTCLFYITTIFWKCGTQEHLVTWYDPVTVIMMSSSCIRWAAATRAIKNKNHRGKRLKLSAINHLMQNISNPTIYHSYGGESEGSTSTSGTSSEALLLLYLSDMSVLQRLFLIKPGILIQKLENKIEKCLCNGKKQHWLPTSSMYSSKDTGLGRFPRKNLWWKKRKRCILCFLARRSTTAQKKKRVLLNTETSERKEIDGETCRTSYKTWSYHNEAVISFSQFNLTISCEWGIWERMASF